MAEQWPETAGCTRHAPRVSHVVNRLGRQAVVWQCLICGARYEREEVSGGEVQARERNGESARGVGSVRAWQ